MGPGAEGPTYGTEGREKQIPGKKNENNSAKNTLVLRRLFEHGHIRKFKFRQFHCAVSAYNKNRNYQSICKIITLLIMNKISSRFTLLYFSFLNFQFQI